MVQKPGFGGEACAAMYLRRLGHPVDQDYVFDQSGVDPSEARGCNPRELATALCAIGFRIGPAWHEVSAGHATERAEALWQKLHADLVAGIPTIVCMSGNGPADTAGQFRLVLGYDERHDAVIFHDPALEHGAYARMARSDFLALWPSRGRPQTLIALRLEPLELRLAKAADRLTAADYAQHMIRLKRIVPSSGFTVVIQPPFVVIGDEPAPAVQRHAEQTVKWAVGRLKAAFFDKEPAEILDIWLFRDQASYHRHCKSLFGVEPETPYGFFLNDQRALAMNIASGGGTLVHEIVHAFIAADFPGCPAWFDEGLACLYERFAKQEGCIRGLTNWRLAGLQAAIRDKRLPALETLCSMTKRQFYQQDRATNYAYARYLCYYLQEHDLLETYYRRFRDGRQNDVTGYQTLQDVLGRPDMAAFQKQWEAFVLELTFP